MQRRHPTPLTLSNTCDQDSRWCWVQGEAAIHLSNDATEDDIMIKKLVVISRPLGVSQTAQITSDPGNTRL